ncbi:MAG: hypothetical protein OXT09_33860 [Myxococcales bacterium]|nr:hypothetical protein [Myxococcales bacterium]
MTARPPHRALHGLVTAAIALLLAPAVAAEQPSTLSSCVDEVLKSVRSEGARPYGKPHVEFLLVSDQRTWEYRLPRDGCFGFMAIGHRQVQHLGLSLYAETGRLLARDPERNAHAYARFCGKSGRRFVAEVRMLDGEGEVHLIPLWDAPPRLKTLERTMQRCMHSGAPRPSPVDVGPEPTGPPVDAELLSVARRLGKLGYRLEGGVLFGGLPERRHEARRIALEGGACYALAAVGDSGVEDIDLRLLHMEENLAVVASDSTRRREAVVKVCPERSGTFLLDVRMYRGAGNYVVQSFGLQEPKDALAEGVRGGTRIPYAELTAQIARRGLRAQPLTWGLLRPGQGQTIPVEVEGGRCYAISAIATPDFAGADLDLSLLDAGGRVVAAEIGPNPHPLVYHCAERGSILRAVLRGHDLRRPGRFLLVVGHDDAQEVAEVSQ